jgi:CheY-like chemotaxis protein
LKFTNEGSVNISVTIKEKSVDDCLLKFVVRDRGVGMTGQQLEKIFERFDQGENDISRKYGGTGLGLAIVKNLVELQGGNIYAESKSNVGSTFIFEIPFKLQTEKNKVKIICPQSLELDKELKLLVVDDNEMNLMLVEYLLSDWGIYYQTANNGAEAIAKLQQSEFNLVLMDVQMPEMDGYTATQKIRSELNMNIPIIAMTAHVLPGEQERCKAQGMDDYISKPLQEETLQRIIAKYSGKKPKASDETNTGFIDAKMLHHKFSGNIDFIKRIVSKTLHHFTGELQELNAAIFNKDATAVMELAHKMRSTVSLLSHHSQLVDWLSEIEILSTKKVTDWEQITSLVKNLTASEEQLQSEAQILLNDIETKALLQP